MKALNAILGKTFLCILIVRFSAAANVHLEYARSVSCDVSEL